MADKTLDPTAKRGIVVNSALVDRWNSGAQQGHFHGTRGKMTVSASIQTVAHLHTNTQRGRTVLTNSAGEQSCALFVSITNGEAR